MKRLRILITGAAGQSASQIRPLLRDAGHKLVLLDISPIGDLHDGEERIAASITDADALRRACIGVDLVVHLGGFSRERPWSDILSTNIDGTQKVLEAAHSCGVERVLLASSTHAIGFTPVEAGPISEPVLPRPDTYYGVSKVAAEALGSVFADRFGMTVVAVRIGTFGARPHDIRQLSTWMSYGDFVRLIEAVATTTASGFHIVWGTSANSRQWFSLEPGRTIGFVPIDDAEEFAHDVDDGRQNGLVGSVFTDADHPLGGTW